MKDQNILDEPPEDKRFGGTKLNIGDAMVSRKHLAKAREDVKRIK